MKTSLLKSAVIAVLIALSTNAHAFTAVTSGAWSSAATWGGVGPGSAVSNQDIIIPTGITVNMDVDVSFSGIVNTFTVDGTLNSSTSNNLIISAGTLAGSGTINIHRISFSGVLTTATFSGTMTLNSLQNLGATLAFTAVATISDTLDLDAGSLLLNTGSNLSMVAGSNVRVNSGTLSSGGGVFTTVSPYDVWYFGTSKTTGLEVNSTNLRDLHVNLNDNLQILTQGIGSLTVNGTMDLAMGRYDFSTNHLTLKGDLMQAASTVFSTSATSDLTISGAGNMSSDMVFASSSTINNLEVDRSSGNYKLASALMISGTVYLTNGEFRLNSGSTLTMNAGSSFQVADGYLIMNGGMFNGSASYNVSFIGGSHDADPELYGSGLNNVTLAMASGNDTLLLDNNIVINGNLAMNSGMLSLEGYDLTLNATLQENAGAYFIGDSTSTLNLFLTSTGDTIWFGGTGGLHLDVLNLNIPAGSSVLLASDLTIHGALNFTSGKLEITNSNLHFRSAAMITGYDETHYIMTSGTGKVEMQVNSNSTYVVYPVGTSDYSPAKIQQTSTGTTGMFSVRVMNNVYANGTNGFDESTIERVVDRTWDIDAASTVVVNMNLKLDWMSADEVNGFNRSQSHISRYNGSSWDTYPASAAAPAANNTYESTRSGLGSDGQFAVADTSVTLGIPAPVAAEGISVYPNPAVDFVTVSNNSNAVCTYELYDATGKMLSSVSNADVVNKFDLASYSNGFYFIRIIKTDSNAVVTKRIVKN
jgi:hypothetical protein